MNYQKISNLFLRYGLALTYLFSGYDLIANPRSWSVFVPYWFANMLPVDVLTYIQIQGVVELLIALAFITGYFIRPAAFVSALEMVAILLLYGVDAVTFRDLAILGGSLALFVASFAPEAQNATAPVAATAPVTEVDQKKKLSDSQRRFRIIMVSVAFLLFSIILVGLFWLSNTTKDQAGWLAFSYATGLSMIVLPCTLPLAFVIVPLAMGKDPRKGLGIAFAFALGVTITLSMYGALIAKLGQVVGLDQAKNTMYLIAGMFAVVFGLGELGLIKMRVPTYSGAFPSFIQNRKDAFKGLLLGLLLGNVGLGCPNPAFYVLLSHIATVGSMSTGWFLTFIHAIGRVTPLMFLAILGALGVDALTVLMKRREALTRATAWGVVGVGAFILCFGLLGHDWYVYSGIHSLLEIVTQEAAFMTSYAEKYGGIGHAHGIPTGTFLPYGSWLMVTLIAIPMLWTWRKEKKNVDQANPEAVNAYKWYGRYTIAAVTFLYLLFAITIPNWFIYKVGPSMDHGSMNMSAPAAEHGHTAGTPDNHDYGSGMTDATAVPVEIKMTNVNKAVRNGTQVTLTFEVTDKATGQPTTKLDLSHEKLMHVVGVRQGDLNQFFHIHPDIQNNRFVATHIFTEPGTYSIWPGVSYGGAHLTPRMPDLVIGTPAPIANFQPAYERIARLNDDLVVTMKAANTFYAGTDHNFGFAITDAGGFDVPLGKYLAENMHINIISPNVIHYHHLHTNYGMIGSDAHGGAHDHSSAPTILKWGIVPVAQAQSDGHTDHAHGTTSAPATNEEGAMNFNDKDMRMMFNFPEAGKYKIFTEFVTAANPSQVQKAEFWVDVGAAKPVTGFSMEGVPKWLLALISLILIGAVMPFIFKYLNEDKIKV